ncbi:MAG: hypothetical protein N2423_08600 [Novosphingobium sp.]|nr:hypothetical protein [Novosphingobium sp.]
MAVVLSIMVLAVFALVGAAMIFWRRQDGRRQAVLMLVLAAVIAANIALLTVPGSDGKAPVTATPE